MKYLLIIGCLCLASCAQDPIYTPVSIDKPVEIKCHIPQVNAPKMPIMTVNDSLFTKVQDLVTEIQLRKSYEAKLVAANKACQ